MNCAVAGCVWASCDQSNAASRACFCTSSGYALAVAIGTPVRADACRSAASASGAVPSAMAIEACAFPAVSCDFR